MTPGQNWDDVIGEADDLTEDDADTAIKEAHAVAPAPAPAPAPVEQPITVMEVPVETPHIDVIDPLPFGEPKPRFDTVSAPLSEMPHRQVEVVNPKPLAFNESNVNIVDASELAEAAAKVSEALAGEPVSNSPEPIRLADPEQPAMQRLRVGDVDIIATAGSIEYIQRQLHQVAPESVPAPQDPIPVPQRITDQTSAEQEAGRRALARNQARAQAHPVLPKTAQELAREAPPVNIIRSDAHPLQHLLNKTPTPGKGEGI